MRPLKDDGFTFNRLQVVARALNLVENDVMSIASQDRETITVRLGEKGSVSVSIVEDNAFASMPQGTIAVSKNDGTIMEIPFKHNLMSDSKPSFFGSFGSPTLPGNQRIVTAGLVNPASYLLLDGKLFGPSHHYLTSTPIAEDGDVTFFAHDYDREAESRVSLTRVPTIFMFSHKGETVPVSLTDIQQFRNTYELIGANTINATVRLCAIIEEFSASRSVTSVDVLPRELQALARNSIFVDLVRYIYSLLSAGSVPIIPLQSVNGKLVNERIERDMAAIERVHLFQGSMTTILKLFVTNGSLRVAGVPKSRGSVPQRTLYHQDFQDVQARKFLATAHTIACALSQMEVPTLTSQILSVIHVSFNNDLSSNPRSIHSKTDKFLTATERMCKSGFDLLDFPDEDIFDSSLIRIFTQGTLGFLPLMYFTGFLFQSRTDAQVYTPNDLVLVNFESFSATAVIIGHPNGNRIKLLTPLADGLRGDIYELEQIVKAGAFVKPVTVARAVRNGTSLTVNHIDGSTLIKREGEFIIGPEFS
jgi:hypothetical protein